MTRSGPRPRSAGDVLGRTDPKRLHLAAFHPNPQLSIMALALAVADEVVARVA